MIRLPTILVLLVLAGCAAPNTLGPGPAKQSGFSLVLEREWSVVSAGEDELVEFDQLTRNGLLLNRIILVKNLKDGESLVDLGFDQAPVFQDWMGGNQLTDWLLASLGALDYRDVMIEAEPVEGLSNPITQYVLAGWYNDDLPIKGYATAHYDGKGLDLIIFLAPEEHYFTRLGAEVARMMGYAHLLDEGGFEMQQN